MNLSVGVYDNLEKAQSTLSELRQHGFTTEEIGIIGHAENGLSVPAPPSMVAPENNVMRGVRAGCIFGAVVGALVILALPGLAWVTNAGRWFEVLGGAVLGAVLGSVFWAVEGLMFSNARGGQYERELEQGHFIVTVNNPRRFREALNVLSKNSLHAEANLD